LAKPGSPAETQSREQGLALSAKSMKNTGRRFKERKTRGKD